MGTFALRVTNGSKRYHRAGHDHLVFHSVNLEVQHGEVFALLGPSGCGKSTLLRTIGGLEQLSAGEVEISKDGGGSASHRPPMGMAFQEPLLFPWLTVAENVALGLGYHANRAARETESVEQLLHDFGLAAIADSYPGELSGGQAQRVSLARTIVIRPKILLLDEPFAALDPRTRAALQDWLLDVTRRRGLTVIIVTHDVDEAMYLGDRVGLMSNSPSTIVRVWDLRPGRVVNGNRRDASEGATAIRREILVQYQTDVQVNPAAPNWVI